MGHLSMKKISDRSCRLGPKFRQIKVLGGGNHFPLIEQKLTYFYNHEDDIQS